MWFGTLDGLNKYDGYAFTVYHHRRSDPNSLLHNTVTALYEDRLGTLWTGTAIGLDSFAGGERFTHHPAIAEQVGAIYEDAAGMLSSSRTSAQSCEVGCFITLSTGWV
jgi:two-component system sensor histidine kinase ChiS